MPTNNLAFTYPWRPEQQKVLNRLDTYLDDKKVHIIAAPGAGKTVLGLEVFNRLNLQTLVFSPTVVVKDQWLERLSSFTSCGTVPDWTSTSLAEPSHFTSTTYQALYSFDKRLTKASTGLKQWFEEHNFGLIILDEAHHLKASWWKVLYELVKDNDKLIIVSLTATPPYDSNTTEWSRYKRLCGAVDEEISIPELVKSGSLCPHQDYIWLVKTDEKNIKALARYEDKLGAFLLELNDHQELAYVLQLYALLAENETVKARDVLLSLDVIMSLLALMKHWQQALPEHLLSQLAIRSEDIKELTIEHWEVLLAAFLKGTYYPQVEVVEDLRETLSSLLKSRHYLKYNRVKFDNTHDKLDRFNKTEERITACFDVANIEVENRRSLLRMVVLTDYIRDEELSLGMDGRGVSAGAYPIFHYYIHHFESAVVEKIALLTGRLSILPKSLWKKLLEIAPSGITTKAFAEHEGFVVCTGETSELTTAFTQLLKQGDLHIIVGTRGLLGEGWDAPFLNALVMATQTKAYVATNQLRGRVMRIDPDDDLKTASIWHIVATAPDQRLNNLMFDNLKVRFRTFAGVHAYDLKIESGTERLSLGADSIKAASASIPGADQVNQNIITLNNHVMQARLQDDLFNLQARWQNALAQAKHQVFQVGLHYKTQKGSTLYSLERLQHSVNYLVKTSNKRYLTKQRLLSVSATGGGLVALGAAASSFVIPPLMSFSVAGISALVSASSFGYRAFKQRPLARGVNSTRLGLKVALVVLRSLHHVGLVKTELRANLSESINVDYVENGGVRFSLNDYTRQENQHFLEAMNDFIQPLSATRYLLALTEQADAQDMYSIPKLVGNKKQDAEYFLTTWQQVFPEFPQATILLAGSQLGEASLLRASAQRLLNNHEQAAPLQMIERWE